MSRLVLIAAAVATLATACAHRPPSPDEPLDAVALREDLDQLVDLLETTHPDPYERGGGRIAFARRVQAARAGIPRDGMTPRAFLRLVRPLVASVGDTHTSVWMGHGWRRLRPWIRLEPVDDGLYVTAVYRLADRRLLGARVEAIRGLPVAELRRRMAGLRGEENRYTTLGNVARALEQEQLLAELLRQGAAPKLLKFRLRTSDGEAAAVTVPLVRRHFGRPFRAPTALQLPALDAAGIAWALLDEDRVGYLRLASCDRYREAFEAMRAAGHRGSYVDRRLPKVARRANRGEPLDGVAAQLAAVPSLTESLIGLLDAMRTAGADALIIDLRGNRGGLDITSAIIDFMLFGVPKPEPPAGYAVIRYSELYAESNRYADERIHARNPGIRLGDYDFCSERRWRVAQEGGDPSEVCSERGGWVPFRWAALTPTFDAVRRSGPEREPFAGRIVVVTDAFTRSEAFTITVRLSRRGAVVVGVPPGQSGNVASGMLEYALDHSGLTGSVALMRWSLFPRDEARGRVFEPTVELTAEAFARLDYDPNASVRLALEYLARR